MIRCQDYVVEALTTPWICVFSNDLAHMLKMLCLYLKDAKFLPFVWNNLHLNVQPQLNN